MHSNANCPHTAGSQWRDSKQSDTQGHKMTHARGALKEQRRFNKAIQAIDRGETRCRAALMAGMPLSTFQYHLARLKDTPSRRTYITTEEEQVIVTLVNRYSSRGFPVNREDLAGAV